MIAEKDKKDVLLKIMFAIEALDKMKVELGKLAKTTRVAEARVGDLESALRVIYEETD